MKNQTKNKRAGGYLSTLLLAGTIGFPSGIIGMQHIIYKDTINRLERLAEESPMLAEDLADRFVAPESSIFKELGLYGAKRAAMDYLRKN